jgi:hypothetical protein
MAHHKLELEEDYKETYSLVAIHCSEEAYKMAYILNKYVGLRLQRRNVDLEYSNKGLEITFSLFEYEDSIQYTTYNLVANKCKSEIANVQSSSGLFSSELPETVVTYLLPEHKRADYFLKIYSDFEIIPMRKLVFEINQIKQVISAYTIDAEELKSKSNLIFD